MACAPSGEELTPLLVLGQDAAVSDTAAAPAPAPLVPSAPVLKRLTRAQYVNSLRDLLGPGIVPPSATEPDLAQSGFLAVGAARTSISPRGVEQYESGAFSMAAQVMDEPDRRAALMPCAPRHVVDDECARAFVRTFGLRAWRRPLTVAEEDGLVAIARAAAEALGDFHTGLQYPLAALLQSPNFLFRVEVGEADPGRPGLLRYTSWEMASRLSYFLWNTTPDEALLDAAARDELVTDAGLRAEVGRLLADERARSAVRGFFSELLRLHELDRVVKDPNIYHHYSPDLGASAREETLRVIEHLVFDEEADVRDLFTTRTTFVDRRLAAIYNVPAPAREGFARIELPADGPRAGYFGQVSFLALFAHPVSSSATLRGKFVRQTLLCGEIPPPPSDVNTALPEPSPELPTLKERVVVHLTNPACSSCHLLMDPIGLGFEQFDGIGHFRPLENGAVVDPASELDGVDYADARQLASIVRDHPDTGPCMVRNLYRYATGNVEGRGEGQAIDALAETFEAEGFQLKALMEAMVLSPIFRYARPEAP